jgi:hypothetical protein
MAPTACSGTPLLVGAVQYLLCLDVFGARVPYDGPICNLQQPGAHQCACTMSWQLEQLWALGSRLSLLTLPSQVARRKHWQQRARRPHRA